MSLFCLISVVKDLGAAITHVTKILKSLFLLKELKN